MAGYGPAKRAPLTGLPRPRLEQALRVLGEVVVAVLPALEAGVLGELLQQLLAHLLGEVQAGDQVGAGHIAPQLQQPRPQVLLDLRARAGGSVVRRRSRRGVGGAPR